MKRSINDVEQDNAGLARSAPDPKRPRTEYNYEIPKQFSNPASKQPTKADATVPAKDTLEALVDHTPKELHTLISLEIDKQRKLLCSRFYASSSREFTQDMMDLWCREAQLFEDKTLAQLSLDAKDIESPRGMVLQMMKRQYEILQKAWHKQFPPPEDTRSLEYQRYREHAKRSILIRQLQELQKWTAKWQQRLMVEIDPPQARSSRRRNRGLRQRPGRSATSRHELRINQDHQYGQLPLPARDQNLPVQGGAGPSRPSMARDRSQQRDFSRTFIDDRPQSSPTKSQHICTPDLLTAQSDHLGQHTLNTLQPQAQHHQYGPWTGYTNVSQNQPQHVGIDSRVALGAQSSRRQGQASAASSFVEMPAEAQAKSSMSRATLMTTKVQPPGAKGNVPPFAVGHKKLKEGRVPTPLPASLIGDLPRAQPTQVPASSSIMAMAPQRLQVQPAMMPPPPVVGHALGCSATSSRLGSVGTPPATVRSQVASSVTASPLPTGSFNMYDSDQCPVDSRLPDLVIDHSDSYDFDLGIERETGPAMDTLDQVNMWSVPGTAATDQPPNVGTNSGEINAAGPDSSRLESLEYDPGWRDF